MEFERDNSYRDLQELHDKCSKCMMYHVKLTLTDGSTFDGIIENVDQDRIIVLVGEDVMDQGNQNQPNMQRQYYHYNYGYPGMRYRRFRRQAYPLATLAALSLLPYPNFVPPYPYFAFNPYYY